MSCEECAKDLATDGTDPPCFNDPPFQGEGQGGDGLLNSAIGDPQSEIDAGIPGVTACWIPELDEAGRRILEIRQKLITLGELVGPETVIKMYEVTKEDLELLTTVESELQKITENSGDSETA